MLSSRPNEYGKQFLIRTLGISGALHLGLILLFFGLERWSSQTVTPLSLKHAGSRIRMLGARSSSVPLVASAQQAAVQKAVSNEQAVSKPEKPIVKKKEKAQAPSLSVPKKKVADKKADLLVKKEKNKKDLTKKQKDLSQKDESITKKESSKKTDSKKETTKEEASKNQTTDSQATVKKGSLNQSHSNIAPVVGGIEGTVDQEVNAAEAVWSPDEMVREFGRHFTIPEGFEDFEPFEMTYDTDSEGNVVNISPHVKGPLVVYTAVKDAFLKSTMPQKNRRNIIWLIS